MTIYIIVLRGSDVIADHRAFDNEQDAENAITDKEHFVVMSLRLQTGK